MAFTGGYVALPFCEDCMTASFADDARARVNGTTAPVHTTVNDGRQNHFRETGDTDGRVTFYCEMLEDSVYIQRMLSRPRR